MIQFSSPINNKQEYIGLQQGSILMDNNTLDIQFEQGNIITSNLKPSRIPFERLNLSISELNAEQTASKKFRTQTQIKVGSFGPADNAKKQIILFALKAIFFTIFTLFILKIGGFDIFQNFKQNLQNSEAASKTNLITMQIYNIKFREIEENKINNADHYPIDKEINLIEKEQNSIKQNQSKQNQKINQKQKQTLILLNNVKTSTQVSMTPNQPEESNKLQKNPESPELSQQQNQNYADSDQTLKKQNCDRYQHEQQGKYGHLYTWDVGHKQFVKNSFVSNLNTYSMAKISQEQYDQALQLIDLNHHADQNGFIFAQENPCETHQEIVQRLKSANNKQFKRFNQTYQIDFYHKKQLRFCIVTNSYRNYETGLIYRNIDSILQQNYSNYHVVYTDDASPDDTGPMVRNYLSEKGVEEGKFKVKINSAKKGMMENIFNAITQDCQLGEIAVMLDGDDSFIGTNVLSLLNAVYQKQKVALVWNNFIEIQSNMMGVLGFSREFYDFEINEPNFRQRGILLSSHLKSFYVDLFVKIKVSDLQEESGVFYGGASDTAMMLPMLEMSFPRFKYVPEIVYEYRFDTGQVGMITNRDEQKRALTKIGVSQCYKKLTDFSFIQKTIMMIGND